MNVPDKNIVLTSVLDWGVSQWLKCYDVLSFRNESQATLHTHRNLVNLTKIVSRNRQQLFYS